MRFEEYFKHVCDLVDYAKKNGIALLPRATKPSDGIFTIDGKDIPVTSNDVEIYIEAKKVIFQRENSALQIIEYVNNKWCLGHEPIHEVNEIMQRRRSPNPK